MMNPAPLLILIGGLAALALIELMLTRPQKQARNNPDNKNDRQKLDEKRTQLLPDLSVKGLDERGVEQFRGIIQSANTPNIASFLAFNQPVIPELNSYLNQIQRLIISNNSGIISDLDPKLLGKIIKATRLPDSSAGFRLADLSDSELVQVIGFDQHSLGKINRELMARFGGHDFYRHFSIYCKYKKGVTLHIRESDPDRPTFDILAESGIALKGRDIDMSQRLTLLTFEQLKRMGKDLNLKQAFIKKAEAITTLSGLQGTRVLFSMLYVVDDLFSLRDIEEKPDEIHREWQFLTACANLLVSSADSVPKQNQFPYPTNGK